VSVSKVAQLKCCPQNRSTCAAIVSHSPSLAATISGIFHESLWVTTMAQDFQTTSDGNHMVSADDRRHPPSQHCLEKANAHEAFRCIR